MAHHSQFWGNDAADWTAPAAFAINQSPPSGNDNWVGGAGGNGDWNTPADWSQNSVPGASSDVTFATGDAPYTVTGDATVAAIMVDGDTVTYDGAITQFDGSAGIFLTGVDGANVTLDANSFFIGENGALDFTAGTVLDVQGTLLTGGGSADVLMVDGLSGNLVTATPITLDQLFVQTGGSFAGDVILKAGGSIMLDTSSSLGGGSIALMGNATLYEALAPGGANGSAGVADAISTIADSQLTLASGAGATFLVSGVISGGGDVLIDAGSVELAGVNTYTGSTIVQNASLTVDGQGAVAGGLILLSNSGLTSQPDSTTGVNFSDTVVGFGTTDTIDAMAGNLVIYASQTGLLTFVGGAGSDTVIGGAGGILVTGGSAGDLIFGGTGGLTFTGGTGGSTVVAGAGAMTATGGTGGDLIYGGTSGQDVLNTGDGPTTLVGGQAAQLFATGSANSVLVDGGNGVLNASASTGNDTLFGANGGSDTIISGAATSIVVLSGGASTLYTTGTADVFAGAGALTLAYVAGFAGGVTNVVGFDLGTDHISLAGYAPGTAQQVLDTETVSGGNTALQIPDGDQILLYGVTGLTSANFT